LVLPIAFRIAWPILARGERLFLLVLLAESLVCYKFLYSPSNFSSFDEMLHWATTQDILLRHRLFLDNSLLPISPFYPALEIVTSSICNLTGLAIFPAAILFIAVLRTVFIVALFLFFEKITDSSRIAALACLVYMSCSTYVTFDASYAYETLGVSLCVLVMLSEAEANRLGYSLSSLIIPVILLGTLAVTHHLTAFGCALYLVGVVLVQTIERGQPITRRIIAVLLLMVAIGLPYSWVMFTDNPLVGYLGPVIERGIAAVFEKLSGESHTREFFVVGDGMRQPIANILIGVASPFLTALALATGFFRSLAFKIETHDRGWMRVWRLLQRRWTNSRVVLLTLAAFSFPMSVAFRLTTEGWEIGNRMNTYAFFAVGLVVAISIVHFWQTRITRTTLVVTSIMIGTILLGGVVTGSGYQPIRSSYLVSADSDSIEPMGINASLWVKEWLGPGNRFASDRVNRSLLATYGDQDVVSSLQARSFDESPIFVAPEITPNTLFPIRLGKLDYLLTDMRLTTAKPVMGHYYERGEHSSYPLSSRNLLKWDNDQNVGRIFDDGWILIYDVSRLHDKP
jgi:hypothetical protein